MRGLFSYSGIATKTRAMSGKLLTRDDYIHLASANSVPEAVAFLKQHTVYRDILEDIPENMLHRGEIEKILLGSLYRDFSRIYRFCNGKQRQVLELYFCKYEIQLLKRELRRIFNPGTAKSTSAQIGSEFRSYSNIDMEQLNASESLPEFLQALRGTPYYEPVSQLSQQEGRTLFDYELVLDLFYFSYIWKEKKKLMKGKELELFTQIYGSQIDMLNMMWIFRAKKYYQIPASGIYALIIPVTYKLKKEQIQKMVEADPGRALEQAVQATYYGRHHEELKEQDLEVLYRQMLVHIYQQERQKSPYSMAVITSYLFQKEQEIDQITTVLECVRYGLTPSETLKYIP